MCAKRLQKVLELGQQVRCLRCSISTVLLAITCVKPRAESRTNAKFSSQIVVNLCLERMTMLGLRASDFKVTHKPALMCTCVMCVEICVLCEWLQIECLIWRHAVYNA